VGLGAGVVVGWKAVGVKFFQKGREEIVPDGVRDCDGVTQDSPYMPIAYCLGSGGGSSSSRMSFRKMMSFRTRRSIHSCGPGSACNVNEDPDARRSGGSAW
jgi:hypothetical protein